jgi:hypothetical protein
MVECIFTLDYEIYGNGSGSLAELVYEPTVRLKEIFERRRAPFVNFVEVAELERIEERGTDRAIGDVKQQVRELYNDGFETALHLHPQWYNASYEGRQWRLDAREYNLCTLARPRIVEIVERALAYLRHLVGVPSFVPLSFRAGNWLFQPTRDASSVLAEKGIRIDSSVFKGGVQHLHGLDYRPALGNGDYWRFTADVNQPDPTGPWIEVPIYTKMVPLWKMRTAKRMAFRGAPGGSSSRPSPLHRLQRMADFLRVLYPLKLDFCRMTLAELISRMEGILRNGRRAPDAYRPIVAIGHTKDLVDLDTIDRFLEYLSERRIKVTTFAGAYQRLSAA